MDHLCGSPSIYIYMYCRYLDDYGSGSGILGEITISMEDHFGLYTGVLHIFGELYRRSDNTFCINVNPSFKMISNLVFLVQLGCCGFRSRGISSDHTYQDERSTPFSLFTA